MGIGARRRARRADRDCAVRAIGEAFAAARILSSAVDAHMTGDARLAAMLIRQADMSALAHWADRVRGPRDADRPRRADGPAGSARRTADRTTNDRVTLDSVSLDRMTLDAPTLDWEPSGALASSDCGIVSPSLARAVAGRDGHGCRFCGTPTIERGAREMLRAAYPDALRWGSGPDERHAAFDAMALRVLHVLPPERGGETVDANLVAACEPCHRHLRGGEPREAGLRDPRERRPLDGTPGARGGDADWDGLVRLFAVAALPARDRGRPNAGSGAGRVGWRVSASA